MKCLVVGLGSMGKRRISCLQTLHESDIVGYDTRADRRKEAEKKFGIQTCSNLEVVLIHQPDAMFICTPPNLHEVFIEFAITNNIDFFTELNMEPVKDFEMDYGFPSCSILFSPSFKYTKERVKQIEPLTFNYHFGLYLPYWHPWEDYKDHFASKKETHACKEIILFDLVWLTKLFGPVSKVHCEKRKSNIIDSDINDIYNIIFVFKNGITGNALYDCVSKQAVKRCEIVGRKKNYTWDLMKSFYNEKGKMYLNETKSFLDAIYGKAVYPYSFEEETQNLEVMEMIENAS